MQHDKAKVFTDYLKRECTKNEHPDKDKDFEEEIRKGVRRIQREEKRSKAYTKRKGGGSSKPNNVGRNQRNNKQLKARERRNKQPNSENMYKKSPSVHHKHNQYQD